MNDIKIIVVDDDEVFSKNLSELLKLNDYKVDLFHSYEEGFSNLRKDKYDICLFDIELGEIREGGFSLLEKVKKIQLDLHVVLMSTLDDYNHISRGIKLGASDFLSKQNDPDEMILRIDTIAKNILVEKENKNLKLVLNETHKGYDIVTQDSKMLKIISELNSVSQKAELNILINGENGTGKELIARYAHNASLQSCRYTRPFVAVNCAAIPESLLESVLFGYVKGAFTGANDDRAGKFELANGGDIFLDEIGTLPMHLQSKLLRVLQEKEIERIGSNKIQKINFRVISATNENLEQMIASGKFRQDLYFRLKGYMAELPPLRMRKGDVNLLLDKFIGSGKIKISKEAMSLIESYSWPGNIRELKSSIELAVALSKDNLIRPKNLPINFCEQENESTPENLQENKKSSSSTSIDCASSDEFIANKIKFNGLTSYIEEIEKQAIKIALETTKNQSAAAEFLKIPAPTLTRKIKEYGLK